MIVRSVFPAGGAGVARAPGYNSASLTQNIDALLTGYAKGQFRQYAELIQVKAEVRTSRSLLLPSNFCLLP